MDRWFLALALALALLSCGRSLRSFVPWCSDALGTEGSCALFDGGVSLFSSHKSDVTQPLLTAGALAIDRPNFSCPRNHPIIHQIWANIPLIHQYQVMLVIIPIPPTRYQVMLGKLYPNLWRRLQTATHKNFPWISTHFPVGEISPLLTM